MSFNPTGPPDPTSRIPTTPTNPSQFERNRPLAVEELGTNRDLKRKRVDPETPPVPKSHPPVEPFPHWTALVKDLHLLTKAKKEKVEDLRRFLHHYPAYSAATDSALRAADPENLREVFPETYGSTPASNLPVPSPPPFSFTPPAPPTANPPLSKAKKFPESRKEKQKKELGELRKKLEAVPEMNLKAMELHLSGVHALQLEVREAYKRGDIQAQGDLQRKIDAAEDLVWDKEAEAFVKNPQIVNLFE